MKDSFYINTPIRYILKCRNDFNSLLRKMPCQLPADCLNEIFKYLEKDNITLHSCLLVNHLWCQVAVRILWMNVWSFQRRSYGLLAILRTLIACLPNESKDLLNTNGIFIPAPTSKPPLFNYASFCKVLPIF